MLRACLLVLAFAAPAVAALAAPLQPTGKWHLHYLESTCAAQRQFGDYALAFEVPPIGEAIRLVIAGPGTVGDTRQYDSMIDLADGGQPIRTSSLLYRRSEKGRRGLTTVLTPADAARVSSASQLRISTLGSGPKSDRQAPGKKPVFNAEFAIGSTTALAKELNKCVDDLRKHWGIVDSEFPEPAQQAKLNLRGIFKSSDYPRDAMTADQSGRTSYLLMIDKSGVIMDCLVRETSGAASIDFMGCQVIRERARAQPALDASGKPTKSGYIARVNWEIRD